MFNFGESPLHIILRCEATKELKRSIVDISPMVADVSSKGKCKVDIQLKVLDVGFYRIKVFYYLRINKFSETIVNENEGIEIFSFDFNCFWPKLQVNAK